jgi:hypothetical protein
LIRQNYKHKPKRLISNDGAIEVAQQQGGGLHVEGMGELQQSSVKLGAIHRLCGERGVEGDQEEAMR